MNRLGAVDHLDPAVARHRLIDAPRLKGDQRPEREDEENRAPRDDPNLPKRPPGESHPRSISSCLCSGTSGNNPRELATSNAGDVATKTVVISGKGLLVATTGLDERARSQYGRSR